jgi:hypothetical protein
LVGRVAIASALSITNYRHVLTASTDGTARLWDVDIDDTVAALCSRLLRDFTPEERAQYGIPDDGPTCAAGR